MPDNHQIAIGECGDVRQLLCAGGQRGVDQQLSSDLGASVVETLQHDVLAAATSVRVGGPYGGEPARIRCHHAVVLVADGRSVEQNRGVLGNTGCVITLAVDAITRVVGGVVLPGDDEAAVGQARHMRVILNAAGSRVDSELRAYRDAAGVVALRIDPVAAAVLAVGGPDDHISVRQLGNLWIVL